MAIAGVKVEERVKVRGDTSKRDKGRREEKSNERNGMQDEVVRGIYSLHMLDILKLVTSFSFYLHMLTFTD